MVLSEVSALSPTERPSTAIVSRLHLADEILAMSTRSTTTLSSRNGSSNPVAPNSALARDGAYPPCTGTRLLGLQML